MNGTMPCALPDWLNRMPVPKIPTRPVARVTGLSKPRSSLPRHAQPAPCGGSEERSVGTELNPMSQISARSSPRPPHDESLPADNGPSTDVANQHPDVAILPVGSFEQHGSHLPLATDTIIACAIAEGLAHAYGLRLLYQRHLQAHSSFCREYNRVAKSVEPSFVGTWPSRATLHRWMTGDVKRLPYPDHCRILEGMFQGFTVHQLLQPWSEDGEPSIPSEAEMAQLMDTVRHGLAAPAATPTTWAVAPRSPVTHDRATLTMPPSLSARIAPRNGDVAPDLGRSLVALQKRLRLNDEDTRQLALLAGQVVDLSVAVAIAIERNGDAVVTYTHEIINLSPRPLQRIPRQMWFEHTNEPRLTVTPIVIDGRRFMIQRTHDTAQLSKFACQFSPAIEPGGFVRFGYSCLGGRFLEDYYCRQDVTRPTRHVTITVHHRRSTLLRCSAIEQLQDGSETSQLTRSSGTRRAPTWRSP